jgi:3'-5' exonuclease
VFNSETLKSIKKDIDDLEAYALKIKKEYNSSYRNFFSSNMIMVIIREFFDDSIEEDQEYFPEQLSKALQILSAADHNQIISIGIMMYLRLQLINFE